MKTKEKNIKYKNPTVCLLSQLHFNQILFQIGRGLSNDQFLVVGASLVCLRLQF